MPEPWKAQFGFIKRPKEASFCLAQEEELARMRDFSRCEGANSQNRSEPPRRTGGWDLWARSACLPERTEPSLQRAGKGLPGSHRVHFGPTARPTYGRSHGGAQAGRDCSTGLDPLSGLQILTLAGSRQVLRAMRRADPGPAATEARKAKGRSI